MPPVTLSIPVVAYATIRASIRPGDLLLCAGSSPMSRMIQQATNSLFSHVGFVWYLAGIDRLMVLESVESIGIRAVPLSHYVENYNGTGAPYPGRVFLARHAAFPAELPPRTRFAQHAVDLLGSFYDQKEIVAIVARIVAAKLGLRPWEIRRGRTYICSEYIYECYKAIGVLIPYDPRGFIAPADFAACPEVQILWEIHAAPAEETPHATLTL